MSQTSSADQLSEYGASREPQMTVVRAVAILSLGCWLAYSSIVEGQRLGAVDRTEPTQVEVFGSFKKKGFLGPETWLLVTPPTSGGKHVRIEILPDQVETYRRGDVVTVYPIRGTDSYITDRELVVAGPLWRVGRFAFSWHLYAAGACFLAACFYALLGGLGIARLETKLTDSLVLLHEGLDLLFFGLVMVFFAASAVFMTWIASEDGARFEGIDASSTLAFEIEGFRQQSLPFHRHRFFATGFPLDGGEGREVEIDKKLYLQLRTGQEILVVRCNPPRCLALPRDIENAQPLVSLLGRPFSRPLLVTPLPSLLSVFALYLWLPRTSRFLKVLRATKPRGAPGGVG